MFDLDTIVGSSDNLLPTEGFWGFILEHWLMVAVAVMLLGFVIDQVLYVVRYRPQDQWRSAYYALRCFLTEKFGAKPAQEPEKHDCPPAESRYRQAPVIRRGGAQYAPKPSTRAAAEPMFTPFEDEDDEDAPTIVRAAAQPSVRRQSAEPHTLRREERSE